MQKLRSLFAFSVLVLGMPVEVAASELGVAEQEPALAVRFVDEGKDLTEPGRISVQLKETLKKSPFARSWSMSDLLALQARHHLTIDEVAAAIILGSVFEMEAELNNTYLSVSPERTLFALKQAMVLGRRLVRSKSVIDSEDDQKIYEKMRELYEGKPFVLQIDWQNDSTPFAENGSDSRMWKPMMIHISELPVGLLNFRDAIRFNIKKLLKINFIEDKLQQWLGLYANTEGPFGPFTQVSTVEENQMTFDQVRVEIAGHLTRRFEVRELKLAQTSGTCANARWQAWEQAMAAASEQWLQGLETVDASQFDRQVTRYRAEAPEQALRAIRSRSFPECKNEEPLSESFEAQVVEPVSSGASTVSPVKRVFRDARQKERNEFIKELVRNPNTQKSPMPMRRVDLGSDGVFLQLFVRRQVEWESIDSVAVRRRLAAYQKQQLWVRRVVEGLAERIGRRFWILIHKDGVPGLNVQFTQPHLWLSALVKSRRAQLNPELMVGRQVDELSLDRLEFLATSVYDSAVELSGF